jgi:DNA-binding beta-propeller fold protein YncE
LGKILIGICVYDLFGKKGGILIKIFINLLILFFSILWTGLHSNAFVETLVGTGQSNPISGGEVALTRLSVSGIDIDSLGNIYFADFDNHAIRFIDENLLSSSLTGDDSSTAGYRDGLASLALLNNPQGICFDEDSGDLFIADSGNQLIRRLNSGFLSTYAGSFGEFDNPVALEIDEFGNLFVLDQGDNSIKMVSSFDFSVSTIVNSGLNKASDIKRSSSGEFFIADSGNHAIKKLYRDETLNWILEDYAGGNGQGFADGHRNRAVFNNPKGLAINANNEIFVSDTSNNLIRIISEDQVETLSGSTFAGFMDADLGHAFFDGLSFMSFSPEGDLLIADSGNNRIRKIASVNLKRRIHPVDLSDAYKYKVSDHLSISYPTNLIAESSFVVDSSENVFMIVIDQNDNYRILKIDKTSNESLLEIEFKPILDIGIDKDDNIYILEEDSYDPIFIDPLPDGMSIPAVMPYDYFHIKKLSPELELSTLLTLYDSTSIEAMTITANGDIYLADSLDFLSESKIRKLDSDLNLTDLYVSYSPDDFSPVDLVRNSQGEFIFESKSKAGLFKKIISDLTEQEFSGSVKLGFKDSKNNGIANFSVGDSNSRMAIDSQDQIFIADRYNHRIRRIDTNGSVATIAGTGYSAASINGNGDQASFNQPTGIFVNFKDEIFVYEEANSKIRKIVYEEPPIVVEDPEEVNPIIPSPISRPPDDEGTVIPNEPTKIHYLTILPVRNNRYTVTKGSKKLVLNAFAIEYFPADDPDLIVPIDVSNQVTWSSNLAGKLGTGKKLILRKGAKLKKLIPGTHKIKAKLNDVEDEIEILVRRKRSKI